MTPQKPRRLLVISYHFPPDGAVGGLRWSGLTKYLARRGWEIHVLTAAAQTGAPKVDGVVVHYCPQARTLEDRYKTWRSRGNSAVSAPRDSAQQGAAAATRKEETFSERVRRSLSFMLGFPDDGRGWIFRAGAAARSLNAEHSFDAVVSSGPPHSGHLAAMLATVGRQTPTIVDMRDPWSPIPGSLGPNARSNHPGWFGLALTVLERLVIRRGSRLIANTSEFAEILRRTYPHRDVSFVPNGIDPDRLPAPAARFAELTISYLGTMYINRDLTPVIRAMQEFLATHPEAAGSIKLRIAGAVSDEYLATFWGKVDAAGLRDAVEFRGRVPGAEAMDLINRSHLTLVLAQGQPKQIPAKLYECASMRVPTLVIAEADSAAFGEARRIGVMACESSDVTEIRTIIERLWRNPDEQTTLSVPITYDGIAAQIDAILREVIDRQSGERATSYVAAN